VRFMGTRNKSQLKRWKNVTGTWYIGQVTQSEGHPARVREVPDPNLGLIHTFYLSKCITGVRISMKEREDELLTNVLK